MVLYKTILNVASLGWWWLNKLESSYNWDGIISVTKENVLESAENMVGEKKGVVDDTHKRGEIFFCRQVPIQHQKHDLSFWGIKLKSLYLLSSTLHGAATSKLSKEGFKNMRNKCSVGPETSILGIEKLKAQLPFPKKDFSFPRLDSYDKMLRVFL